MPTIHDSNRFGAVDDSRLVIFETWLEARLPDDYRAFLLEHNGGRPEPAGFTVDDWLGGEPHTMQVEWLYALHDDVWDEWSPGGHLGEPLQRAALEWLDDEPGFPAIPIGRCPDGSLILIGIGGSDSGKVFVAERSAEYAVTRVAESFGAFLDRLA